MEITDKKYLKLLSNYDEHCKRIAKASFVNINETPKEKKDRIKHTEEEYTRWFEYYFPNFAKKKCAWYHAEMANDIINHKILRYLAEIFRSGGKSVHIDMGIPLYLYLVKKDLFFMLLIGETEAKAKKLLSGIQAQLQFNKRLQHDYGKKFSQGSWADGDFCTTDGVRFMSLGFGQNPRGAREQAERPDYIVVDDADSKKHVNNDRLMREAVDFITEDVWGCFDSSEDATERFVYANNNFNKNSITNRLKLYFQDVIEKKKEADNEGTYEENISAHFKVLTVCAVKDLVDFEPEWKQKTSSTYWKNKYNSMPYRSFMREYMHVHIEDGAIFKYEDIQYKFPERLGEYDALCFYGDLSYMENADYKAMVLVGKKGKNFQVILSYLEQKSRAHCAKWLYDMYEQFRLERFNINYMIEGLFAQKEFINDFDAEGDKRGYHIYIKADKRSKSDKHDRIESMTGIFERGNIFFNKELKSNYQQILIDQLLAFEKGSKAHDDGPDALHGAVSFLNKRTYKSTSNYAFGERPNRHY